VRPAEPDVRVCADARDLSERAAAATAAIIAEAVNRHGRCSLVLSGGGTPRALYELLASTYRDQIPWSAVHLFWGDERYVDPADAASNYRMAREALLDHVPLGADHVHRIAGEKPPAEAAAQYQQKLVRLGDPPRLDLVLLGMGPDGHTASLFPGSPACEERERFVVETGDDQHPHPRLTFTFPAIARSRLAVITVDGPEKRKAVDRIRAGEDLPGARIRAEEVLWIGDRDALGAD
jgi:6-phosphogluconolactonase